LVEKNPRVALVAAAGFFQAILRRQVMDIEGIREVLHRQPFEPFVIRLADGRSLPVPHRDFVALMPSRVVVGAEDDSWSLLEPCMIVSLDSMPAKPKGSNGSSKRRPKS
jgi:hypothetical protein